MTRSLPRWNLAKVTNIASQITQVFSFLTIFSYIINGLYLCLSAVTPAKILLSLQGMAYLHSKDIVHKHLTSKNIFVERGEKVVIADFGIQNLTRLACAHSRYGTLGQS